jgi:hypothetical protein
MTSTDRIGDVTAIRLDRHVRRVQALLRFREEIVSVDMTPVKERIAVMDAPLPQRPSPADRGTGDQR